MPVDRLPKPWKVDGNESAFWIVAANGARFAFTYFSDRPLVGTGDDKLTREAARKVVTAFAKLGQE